MSERNYYVICDDNCKFPAMTAEQVLEAIAEATGETPVHIDDAFITMLRELNHNGNLKFWVGTRAQYNALTPVDDIFYIITDENPLDELSEDVNTLKNGVGTAIDYITEKTVANGWNVTKFNSGDVEISRAFDVFKSDFSISQIGNLYKYRFRTMLPLLNLSGRMTFNVCLREYSTLVSNTENMWFGNVQNAGSHVDINFFGFEDLQTATFYSFTVNVKAHIN